MCVPTDLSLTHLNVLIVVPSVRLEKSVASLKASKLVMQFAKVLSTLL